MYKIIHETIFSLLVIVVSGSFFQCEENPGSSGNNATELDGTWTGGALGQSLYYMFTFNGGTFVVRAGRPDSTVLVYTGTYSTDTTVEPRNLDSYIIQSPVQPQYAGKTSLAIYAISHDTLTFAGNEPGVAVRPTSFAQDPAGVTAVFVLKKQ